MPTLKPKLQVEMISSSLDKQAVKTCASCAHSVAVLISQDGKTTQTQCGRFQHPVTGRPTMLADTARLVGMPERTVAIKAAEMMDVCGPLGTFWEEDLTPPKPLGFFAKLRKHNI